MRKLTCSPSAEFLGQNGRGIIDNLQKDEIEPVLEAHGLGNIQPDEWYSLKSFLDVLNDLQEMPNFSTNFVAIGLEIGKIVPMPPDMHDPELGQVLEVWNGLYQYIHRKGDVGNIYAEKVGDKHYKTVHTDCYPDDFSYGIIYGYGRRFLPKGTSFKVYYDDEVKPRDQGGDGPTVIHVKWE